MGNSQSSQSGTRFIETDAVPVVQSYQTCHIFGDPDLYGTGIRYGFYLQYIGAILAFMFGDSKDFRIWRASFVAVAAATLIGLYVNATGTSLIILDWAVMATLVLWFPFFLALPVIAGTVYEHRNRNRKDQLEDIREPLQRVLKDRLNDRTLAIERAYADVLNAERTLEETHDPQVVVRAIQQFITEFGPLDDENEGRPGNDHRARAYLHDIYDDEALERIGGNVNSAMHALRRLPGHHQHALRLMGLSYLEARRTQAAVSRATKRERQRTFEVRSIDAAVHHLRETGFVDKVTAGIALLTYSGYCALAPWLYFMGVDRGAKAGCDVRVLFVFAPLSVYSSSFAVFLKVIGCVAVVVGAGAFLISVLLLLIGLFDGLERAVDRVRNPAKYQPPSLLPPPATAGNNHNAAPEQIAGGDGRGLLGWQRQPALLTQGTQQAGQTTTETDTRTHIDPPKWFPRKWYGTWLAVLLAITWALVEETLKVNGVDMLHKPLTATGELIAFIVGLFTLVAIAHNCAVDGIAKWREARWREREREQREGQVKRSKPRLFMEGLQSWLGKCLLFCCGWIPVHPPDGQDTRELNREIDEPQEAIVTHPPGVPPLLEAVPVARIPGPAQALGENRVQQID